MNPIRRLYLVGIELGARGLLAAGAGPNAVTLASLAIGVAASLLFAWQRQPAVFAALLLAGAFLDALDGEVARRSRRATRAGSYLDAMCDRLFEVATLLATSYVTGHWVLGFVVCAGSFTVSYAKARAALDAPVSNRGWPQVMGREGRTLGLAAGLLLWARFPGFRLWGLDALACALAVLAVAIAVTAGQRFVHARRILLGLDTAAAPFRLEASAAAPCATPLPEP